MKNLNQGRHLTLALMMVCGLCFSLSLVGEVIAQQKPLKVFVLVGQSNMQGHAKFSTLGYLGLDPETKPILDEIVNKQGQALVFDDIWISYLSSNGETNGRLTRGFGADGSKMGPELTFGIYMQKRLGEPILIIKTAWGGKSLNTDFRSPSAGPFVFDEAVLERLKSRGKDVEAIQKQKEEATGVYYRQTVEHVKKVLADVKTYYPNYDEQQGHELAGLVWFQGWNDMVDSGTYPNRGGDQGYQQYGELLGHLIRDFRNDLSAPKLPVVVGVMGVGGPTDQYREDQKRYKKIHQNFRDAMVSPSRLEEFQGNVFPVLTENYWDMELESLIARDNQLKAASRIESKTNSKETRLENMRNEEFTEQERLILKISISNAAYHYLGCGKIMAQIGKGFAEAFPIDAKD